MEQFQGGGIVLAEWPCHGHLWYVNRRQKQHNVYLSNHHSFPHPIRISSMEGHCT